MTPRQSTSPTRKRLPTRSFTRTPRTTTWRRDSAPVRPTSSSTSASISVSAWPGSAPSPWKWRSPSSPLPASALTESTGAMASVGPMLIPSTFTGRLCRADGCRVQRVSRARRAAVQLSTPKAAGPGRGGSPQFPAVTWASVSGPELVQRVLVGGIAPELDRPAVAQPHHVDARRRKRPAVPLGRGVHQGERVLVACHDHRGDDPQGAAAELELPAPEPEHLLPALVVGGQRAVAAEVVDDLVVQHLPGRAPVPPGPARSRAARPGAGPGAPGGAVRRLVLVDHRPGDPAADRRAGPQPAVGGLPALLRQRAAGA